MSEPANDMSLAPRPTGGRTAIVAQRPSEATVRGYLLVVPDAWYGLHAWEREALMNGIGPDRWPAARRAAIDAATGLRAAADVHDVDYCIGRTERDRRDGDRRFLRNCLRIILADQGGWLGLVIRGAWRASFSRALVAWWMYRALRRFGRQAFLAASKVDIAVRGVSARPEYEEGSAL